MRGDLPLGTVTFLFTDVEGSTKLLHALGAAEYSQVLSEHRRILRQAFIAHGGVEVDTQGDAFVIAFPTAQGACRAAAGGRRIGRRTHPCANGPPHRHAASRRGGLHRGRCPPRCAHHGERARKPDPRFELDGRPRGPGWLAGSRAVRLKDLSAPERIYQLGTDDFPPLRTTHQTNLPIPSTPFLGRGPEVEQVRDLLSQERVYLLTLIGPGGIGKTRHAIALGEQALAIFRELGDRAGIAKVLWANAYALYQLDLRARGPSRVTLLLLDSAMLAALRGDLERAVRLFAAGEKLRDESGAMLANVIEAWQVPAVDAIRAASMQLAGARDDGRRLSREDAVALAVT